MVIRLCFEYPKIDYFKWSHLGVLLSDVVVQITYELRPTRL